MSKINDEISRRVQQLYGHVKQEEYEDAIESLKALGGEYAAFAAAHAALVAAAVGATIGAGFVMAFAEATPILNVLFAACVGTGIGTAYISGAITINRWYENLDYANREALSKVIVYGIQVSRTLRMIWRLVAR